MPNNVKKAYATINGVEAIASYDAETDLWTVETTAPIKSSWPQDGHVYQIILFAEDEAGNTVQMDSSDPNYGEMLKLRVLEKTPPIATITKPTTGSVLGQSNQLIKMEIKDVGDSGLDLNTVEFKVNGTDHSSQLEWTDNEAEDGTQISEFEAVGLSDGNNVITLSVKDNDGNKSVEDRVEFIVSTAAPTLEIDTPIEGLITNSSPITVSGKSEPGNQYVTITSVSINGENVSVEGGAFSKDVELDEGENEIVIIATDTVGNTVTVRRKVILDTHAPIITEVTTERTEVEAGGMIKITFRVTDNS